MREAKSKAVTERSALEADVKRVIRDIPDFPREGIIFKDVTPLFYDQSLCNRMVDALIDALEEQPDAIVGIESRGFLTGFLLANRLGIPFVLVRKKGKLPWRKNSVKYALEYGEGEMEMHTDAVRAGWRVIVHDDLLATGGTAAATASLVEMAGASVMAFQFIVSLGFLNGKEKLINHSNNITCLAQY